jgi:glycosyltransferase involved in cell wall biosynthesis
MIQAKNLGTIPKRCGGVLLRPDVWVEVPDTFLSQFGYDNMIEFDFSSYRDQMRSRTEDGRLSFDFWIPFSSIDGYGRHAIDIYKGMAALGADVALRDVGIGWIDHLWIDPVIEQVGLKSRTRMPSKVGLVMSLPYDPHIYHHQSAHKIVITQFETDRFPEKHVENVNKCDHLIVTSSFQPEMMRKSGIKIPISVLTPGIDTDFYKFVERPRDGKFKCLMLGALTGRKNPVGALHMFWKASEGDPSWHLTIKTRKAAGVEKLKKMIEATGDPRIDVVIGDTPPDWIAKIYHMHDCLLWPSKGEGVGLPPMEAMSTGMEVVCARNSGMRDFISDEVAWPIYNHDREPADLPDSGFSQEYVKTFGSVGQWWVPDLEEGVRQLKKAHEAWSKGEGKGKRAADYIRSNHSLRHQAASVLQVVERYS